MKTNRNQSQMFPTGEDLPLFSGSLVSISQDRDAPFEPRTIPEPAPQLPLSMTEVWGEPVSVYSRAQAIEDGVLVDVTEWASAKNGFIGGFTCPVAFTAAVWALVEVPAVKGFQDTRGRAHDVLWMGSLALRSALKRSEDRARFVVKIGNRNHRPMIVIDSDGVTIGLPEDF